MRRASKAAIAANLEKYGPWRESCQSRLVSAGVPGSVESMTNDLDKIRDDITSGDLGYCVAAHIAHVNLQVRLCEEGYYRGVDGSARSVRS